MKIAANLDVLHFQYAVPFAHVADEVKRRLGKASPLVVGTLHGTDVSIHGRDPIRGPMLFRALQNADVLTTVSTSHSNLSAEIFDLGVPPQIIPNFVDLKKFHPRDPDTVSVNGQRRPRIAHVSNFRAVKQPEVMAGIFSKIREKIDSELWLIGDGPEMREVKNFFQQKNIFYDLDRISFLRNYLAQLQRATSEGVPVKGYFLWSLIDNFEWIYGYDKRFGVYHVDFQTQARTPKLSAAFYRDVVAKNAIGP